MYLNVPYGRMIYYVTAASRFAHMDDMYSECCYNSCFAGRHDISEQLPQRDVAVAVSDPPSCMGHVDTERTDVSFMPASGTFI